MTSIAAIHSVGNSLVAYLRNTWSAELQEELPCEFGLFSSGKLATMTDAPTPSTSLTLFLHRVTFNEHLRNSPRPTDPSGQVRPMSLDLHYLMSVWSDSAEHEQTVLAWAMQQLYLKPALQAASLSPEAGWGPDDYIQITPAELSNEDIMRIWDALAPSYRISIPYIVRCVRIDQPETTARPVVARQPDVDLLEPVGAVG